MYHLNDLESFAAAVEAGGVIAASRQLNTAPATISHRISKLEQTLGVSLFFRSSRGITLSPEGQAFYERLGPIIDALHELNESVENKPNALKGKLRVTIPPWVLNLYLMPKLADFKQVFPNIQLEFVATDTQRDISDEGIDIAIRVGKLPDSRLLARKLADDRRIVCASPLYLDTHGTPETVEDLLRYHFVCLPWLRQLTFVDSKGQSVTVPNKKCTLISNAESLSVAMKQGVGIGIRSWLAVRDCIEKGELVEVLPGCLANAEAPLWYVRPNSRLASQKVETFYEFCFQAINSPRAMQ
ncbi:LysR family transcriptional regulator [Alteromonadaceae bacterium M269]|nr:LysR family transcriptional regulator [Alteromonadaceae bacterium M269]